jgi:hypothetical protein
MMHGPINVKSPNNTSKWKMGFNSGFKGLKHMSVHECTLQSVFVCVNRVLYLVMVCELPIDRANRATSSSYLLTNRYPQPITVLVTLPSVTCD